MIYINDMDKVAGFHYMTSKFTVFACSDRLYFIENNETFYFNMSPGSGGVYKECVSSTVIKEPYGYQ